MNIEKIKNIIKAGAIGDAFGYQVEFSSLEIIQREYGENGLREEYINSWIVSDDTQMTLFCLEGVNQSIKEGFLSIDEINNNIYKYYYDWFLTQGEYKNDVINNFGKNKLLHKRRAPGQTCLSALGSKRVGSLERYINNSKGCGGIMRTAPISFLDFSLEEVIKLGCMQAAITHGNPEGFLSSGFLNGLIYLGIKGKNFEDSYKLTKNEILKYKDSERFITYLNYIENKLNNKYDGYELVSEIGAGWTGEEALGVAVYCFKNTNSFKDCLYMSTNHSGDSDSTASIACQLYASFKDLKINDLEYYEKLDVKEIINKSLDDFIFLNDNLKINKINKDEIKNESLIHIGLEKIKSIMNKK